MNKYLTEITSDNLIKNAYNVLAQKKAGKIPVLNGVKFTDAFNLGFCQKNIRQLVEATIWQKQWRWPEAKCCASNTCSKIKQAGYESLTWSESCPGDLIYTLGGKKCKTCGKEVGHVMLKMDDKNNMWQNTSYEKRSLDIIPIRQDQINRINGVFRLMPQKIKDVTKVIDIDTNKILAFIDGKYSLMYDHLADQNKIYLKR